MVKYLDYRLLATLRPEKWQELAERLLDEPEAWDAFPMGEPGHRNDDSLIVLMLEAMAEFAPPASGHDNHIDAERVLKGAKDWITHTNNRQIRGYDWQEMMVCLERQYKYLEGKTKWMFTKSDPWSTSGCWWWNNEEFYRHWPESEWHDQGTNPFTKICGHLDRYDDIVLAAKKWGYLG